MDQGLSPEEINAFCRKRNWPHAFRRMKLKDDDNPVWVPCEPLTLGIEIRRGHYVLDRDDWICGPPDLEDRLQAATNCVGYED